MDFNTLKGLLPQLPQEYIEEYLKSFSDTQDGISNLFDHQDNLISVGPDMKKKVKCIIPNCSIPKCIFFHGYRDKRRDLTEYNYEPKPCFSLFYNGNWDFTRKCSKGENCKFSHNSYELELHPSYNHSNQSHQANYENRGPPRQGFQSRRVNELKTEIQEIEEYIQDKKKKLNEVQEQIESVEKYAKCYKCERDLMDYVLPCGHILCEKCKVKVIDSCPLCSKRLLSNLIIKIST